MPLWCCTGAHHRDAVEHRETWRILATRRRSPDQEDDEPAWQPTSPSICHRRVFEELWNVNARHGAVSCPTSLSTWATTSRLFMIDHFTNYNYSLASSNLHDPWDTVKYARTSMPMIIYNVLHNSRALEKRNIICKRWIGQKVTAFPFFFFNRWTHMYILYGDLLL